MTNNDRGVVGAPADLEIAVDFRSSVDCIARGQGRSDRQGHGHLGYSEGPLSSIMAGGSKGM